MKLKEDKGTKSRIDLLMRGKLLYHFAGLMAVLLNYAEVPPLPSSPQTKWPCSQNRIISQRWKVA